MASIQINRGTATEVNATPVTDGLISFDTTNQKIYLDTNGTRKSYGGTTVVPNTSQTPTQVLDNIKIDDEIYKINSSHTIKDDSGTVLVDRKELQFKGAYSHDSSNTTIVDVVREMTTAQKDALTGEAINGFQWVTDEDDEGLPLTTDFVEYKNNKSVTEILDSLNTKYNNLIDDSSASSSKTYSSQKVQQLITNDRNLKSGMISVTNGSANTNYTFSVTLGSNYYPDTDYNVFVSPQDVFDGMATTAYTVTNKTVSGFDIVIRNYSSSFDSHTVGWVSIR